MQLCQRPRVCGYGNRASGGAFSWRHDHLSFSSSPNSKLSLYNAMGLQMIHLPKPVEEKKLLKSHRCQKITGTEPQPRFSHLTRGA